MSLTEVDGMVRGINPKYAGTRIDYWYSIGSEEDGKTKLSCDSDVIRMCCLVPEIRLVILYLDHLELDPAYEESLDDLFMYEDQIPGWSQAASSNVVIEELPDSPRKPRTSVKIEELPDSPKKQPQVPNQVKGKRYKMQAIRKALPGVKIIEHQEDVPTQASRVPVIDPTDKGKGKLEFEQVDGDSDDDYDGEGLGGQSHGDGLGGHDDGEGLGFRDDGENLGGQEGEDVEIEVEDGWGSGEDEEECESEGGLKFSSEEDSQDDDYNPAADDDDVAAYGVDDDFLFDWLTDPEGGERASEEGCGTASVGRSNVDEGAEDEDNKGMFGAIDSDEEGIGQEHNSDDDGEGPNFPEFNPKVDMKDPHFCKGMLFATPQILRAAIREQAIQKGWVPIFVKNDKKRLRAICKAENCDFELYASKMQHENTFQIKTYQKKHSCARVIDNTAVRTPYLIEKFADMIQLNPDISTGKC